METLADRDIERLRGVDDRLVRVVRRAATLMPLMVIEGLRTPQRQAELYAIGRTAPGRVVTWTMESKHLTGHAVDVGPVPLNWNDRKAFFALAGAMFAAAQAESVLLRWGGDWDGDGMFGERGESDLPHFEIAL